MQFALRSSPACPPSSRVPGEHARRDLREGVAKCKRGSNGALGIVLVGLRRAEDGHHRIADELLRDPAVALDLAVEELEQLTLELAYVLGVELLAERRRPGEVGKEHAHDSPLLPVGSSASQRAVLECHAAGGAKGRGRRLLRSTTRTGLVQS
jgi:hypothetical protein